MEMLAGSAVGLALGLLLAYSYYRDKLAVAEVGARNKLQSMTERRDEIEQKLESERLQWGTERAEIDRRIDSAIVRIRAAIADASQEVRRTANDG